MYWPGVAADAAAIARVAGVLGLAVTLGCPGDSPSPGTRTQPETPVCPEPAAAPAPPPPIVVPCEDSEAASGTTATSTVTSTMTSTMTSEGDERLTLVPVGFADLPGWTDDSHGDAVAAFLRSCEKLAAMDDRERVGSSRYAGTAAQWRRACTAAARVAPGDHGAARGFFEARFKAYAAHGKDGPQGKITGYYVQPLRASRTRGGVYRFPLFARPPDLVSVQLSEFIADGRSRRIWGRRDGAGRIVPYPERATIRANAEVGPGDEQPRPGAVLLWADDPVDALAVEIEGSGKATLDTGETVWVGFAGKNGLRGRRTGAIMRALRELRARVAERDPAKASEPDTAGRDETGKRPFDATDLEQFYTITDPRAAVVFFHIEERAGAIGTQDVILSAGRSLAVDRAVIGLSTPVWVSTKAPRSATGRAGPWHRLLIAQDTGGSILGSVRADIYWGADAQARAIGRRVNGPGRLWLLLPRELGI